MSSFEVSGDTIEVVGGHYDMTTELEGFEPHHQAIDVRIGKPYTYFVPLEEQGVVFEDTHHTIDIAFADADDARLLGCRTDDPLLRERRRSTDPSGTPVEWSEDRYLPGTVAFSW